MLSISDILKKLYYYNTMLIQKKNYLLSSNNRVSLPTSQTIQTYKVNSTRPKSDQKIKQIKYTYWFKQQSILHQLPHLIKLDKMDKKGRARCLHEQITILLGLTTGSFMFKPSEKGTVNNVFKLRAAVVAPFFEGQLFFLQDLSLYYYWSLL